MMILLKEWKGKGNNIMFILEVIPIITLYIFWSYIILGGNDES